MPTTNIYDKHGGVKTDPLASGRIISVTEQSGDSASTVEFEVPADRYITRHVAEQNLTAIEKENIGKYPPPALVNMFNGDGTKYEYDGSFSAMKRLQNPKNETYTAAQPDDRCGLDSNYNNPAPTCHPSNIPRSST